MIETGKKHKLIVQSIDESGAMLMDKELETVFLPNQYIIGNLAVDEEVEVFVFVDNVEESIATMQIPHFEVDSFVALPVSSVESYGVFLDGGLPKEIFLPNKLSLYKHFQVGEKRLVYISTDPLNGKLLASEKLFQFLSEEPIEYSFNQEIDIRIWRKTPLGFKVIINGQSEGMIFKDQIFKSLEIGSELKGYIKDIRPDGKIDVSLSKQGFRAHIDANQQLILQAIEEGSGFLALTDKSSPESIYDKLGISKKNFKKAVGALYKQRIITLEEKGIRKID